MLALNTTMRESEIRTLRWNQVDFLKRIITVGKSKTSAGTGRPIPINAELFSTLAEHKTWYEATICPVDSQLYVFPFGDCREVSCGSPYLVIQDLVEKRSQEGGGYDPFSRPETYGDNETRREWHR